MEIQSYLEKALTFSTVYQQFNLTKHIGESHYYLPATAIGLKWKVRVISPWNLISKQSYSTTKKIFALAFQIGILKQPISKNRICEKLIRNFVREHSILLTRWPSWVFREEPMMLMTCSCRLLGKKSKCLWGNWTGFTRDSGEELER